MFYRTLGAACAVLLTSLSLAQAAAQAAEPHIVVLDDGSPNLHAKLSRAAEKVCAAALADDMFDEYGGQEDCVARTLSALQTRNREDAGTAAAQKIAYGK